MPTKVSERNLILSVAIFVIAIALLFNAKLFNAPVKISEKGILFIVLGATLSLVSIKLFKKAILRF
jgi:hypothetical protein